MEKQEKDRNPWVEALREVISRLNASDIQFTIRGAAVLVIHGGDVQEDQPLEIEFQWDQRQEVSVLFSAFGPTKTEETGRGASFQATLHGIPTHFFCKWNTAVVTDPTRHEARFEGEIVFVEALTVLAGRLEDQDPVKSQAKSLLQNLQNHNTELSRKAWNTGTFEAWVQRFGKPEELGAQIRQEPERRLLTLLEYLGELKGKNVLNLMGSNGIKAVAMGCLGAEAVVVDLSEESADYARTLALAAGVHLVYHVGDVLVDMEDRIGHEEADVIVMERGILHYFVDLAPLMSRVRKWLKPGGRFVLQDFHPISTKLIETKGKKALANGNYFDRAIHQTPVATSKFIKDADIQFINQRRWTLGEILTAVAEAGLRIEKLDERPNEKKSESGIPKMFTLVARAD